MRGAGAPTMQAYRAFLVGSDDSLTPIQVAIGARNARYAEVIGGDAKPGDAVVVQESTLRRK